VLGIFARENGQGLFFPAEPPQADAPAAETSEEAPTPPPSRPRLQIVK
jgi:stringent starvation protein B